MLGGSQIKRLISAVLVFSSNLVTFRLLSTTYFVHFPPPSSVPSPKFWELAVWPRGARRLDHRDGDSGNHLHLLSAQEHIAHRRANGRQPSGGVPFCSQRVRNPPTPPKQIKSAVSNRRMGPTSIPSRHFAAMASTVYRPQRWRSTLMI